MAKGGCCTQSNAATCSIIATPGGLNPGETFPCSPGSSGSALGNSGIGAGVPSLGAGVPSLGAGPPGNSGNAGSNQCYNDGNPGLTDAVCTLQYQWAGGQTHAYSIPGSMAKGGCCTQSNAATCFIIATPGGLNPGETFDCTKK